MPRGESWVIKAGKPLTGRDCFELNRLSHTSSYCVYFLVNSYLPIIEIVNVNRMIKFISHNIFLSFHFKSSHYLVIWAFFVNFKAFLRAITI